MNKTLLKRLFFEILEDLVRLECQLDRLEKASSGPSQSLIKVLRAELTQQKDTLLNQTPELDKLFDESPLEDAASEKLLRQTFPQWRKQIGQWAKAFYRLQKNAPLPETELFLTSLNLGKLLPESPELVLLTAQDAEDRNLEVPTPNLVLTFLPSLASEAPLQWLGLCESFSRVFAEQTLQLTALLEELNLPEPKIDIIAPLINLRLLGPGYYAHYLLKAYTKADAIALWGVEPLMFQALNRFGLVNKDLVILHQSNERGRVQLGLEDPRAITSVLNDELGESILKIIEKVIPERLAFTEKSFMRSQVLDDRLDQGTLIAAVPPLTSITQLHEDLENSEASLYPLLAQLQESPATPREIINAGWLHKLDHSSDWLTALIDSPDPLQEGWAELKDTLERLDILLQKSIEISEVHRILSREDADALVAV